MHKPLPFSIQQQSIKSLTEQVIDGLGIAISTGYYKPGDVLPTTLDMAGILGVSSIVIRSAVRRLSQRGMICPRPRTGIIVCDRPEGSWLGQVLFISGAKPGMHYHNLLIGTLGEKLLDKRFLLESISVTASELPSDFPRLQTALASSHYDLAVLTCLQPFEITSRILELLHARRIPVVYRQLNENDRVPDDPAAGRVSHHYRPALEAAVAHAVQCGADEITSFCDFNSREELDAIFQRTNLKHTLLSIDVVAGGATQLAIEKSGLAAMSEYLCKSRNLPKLFFFRDDFIARGALLALIGHGLRIPEDVQVITWSNASSGPLYYVPLTRIENDGQREAQAISDYLLGILSKGRVPSELVLAPEFIVGKSTVIV